MVEYKSRDLYGFRTLINVCVILERSTLTSTRDCVIVRVAVIVVQSGHIGWVSSKVITRIICLGFSLLRVPTSAI